MSCKIPNEPHLVADHYDMCTRLQLHDAIMLDGLTVDLSFSAKAKAEVFKAKLSLPEWKTIYARLG
ncbi:hypothetical protein M514_09111 [Trichuris suis]|uniref:Uncharacterized protein n=1 Tax=Trichuris suis TaxID=68888 RepID=A0A085LYH2_9BILA|nr:hypothetical protein M513_09111 [Trichuris suis]KFD64750.1 hypothetical protein M514_09111 [Trichuris suis]